MPILILALFLLLPLPAMAGSDCTSPQTNMEMIDCAGRDFSAADKALNEAYGAVMTKLKAMDKEQPDLGLVDALRKAQRAWIAFRDGQCAWEAGFFNGGSMQPLIRQSCLTELTQARTGQLRQTMKAYASQ